MLESQKRQYRQRKEQLKEVRQNLIWLFGCEFAQMLFNIFTLRAGAQREPVYAKAREAGVASSAEGVSPAAPGRGRGRATTQTEAVLRVAMSPVQEEDAAVSPQPGARPAQRGTELVKLSADI